MKLKSLRLQNYRVHQDSTLPIGDATFVVVRGPNGGGKTSFADAFSMNVAQTSVSLPGDGKGFVKKIAQGESKAIITAEIQGQHLLRSTVTLNTNTSGRVWNIECIDDPDNNKVVNGFKNFLADKKSAILIATSTDYFLKLEEKAQTDLLAKLVLPPRHDFPQDKVEATNALLDAPINFEGEPFDVITASYKALYKLREIVNRQVKEFTIPDALPKPKGVDSESLQTQLVEIRAKRSNLQLERDTAVTTANNIEVKRATLQTKLEALRKDRERALARIQALESFMLSAEQVQRFIDTAAKADELAKLKSEQSGIHTVIMQYGKEMNRFNEILEQGKTCPVCDQEIDPSKIAAALETLKEEHATADHEIQALDTKIEAIGDIQAAKDALKKHEAAVKEKIELETSLTETVKIGKEARAEFDALPAKVDATGSFTKPLADLQAQEDMVNEQLRPVIAAEERAKEIKRLTEQKDKLVAKAATLDTLVRYWDKDGVKAELIGQYIGGFEAKINTVLDAFGCKASLTFEPQMGFDVTTSRGYTGPIKELCGAEGEIFKRAFQCAVSIAAGIKLVVIDEMEELGEDIRGAMFQSVYSLIDEGLLEQAIMIGFSLDKTLPPKEKRAPGSKYFFVEDGSVVELQ